MEVNIIRESISQSIDSYKKNNPSFIVESDNFHKTDESHRMIYFKHNGKDGLLHIYYKKNGKTNFVVGRKNVSIEQLLIDHITSEDCIKNIEVSSKSISLSITDIDFKNLLEFYKQNNVSIKLIDTNYTLSSVYGDKIYFSLHGKMKLQIQGKPLFLFGLTLNYLSYNNLYSSKEINSYYATIYQATKGTDELKKELLQIMPNCSPILPNTLIGIVLPSLQLKYSNLKLTDYSAYVFPVLKGVEGLLKILLEYKKCPIYTSFSQFQRQKTTKLFILKNEFSKYFNIHEINALEKLYNYYSNKRHPLYHVDNKIITTKTIPNRSNALSLMDDTFQIMEDSYILYKK